MTWSFSIGHLLGSELRVHATFFLLLAWIGFAAYVEGGTMAAIENVLFVIAIFACVVAHEFGHALAARRYGISTPDITLLPIGGMARLMRMPEDPRQEIVVALAGPAVNVVIWAVIALFVGVEVDFERVAAVDDPAASFLGRLAAVNLFLAVFNLIPAFPMDGGRVLRALLSIRLDRVRATKIAATAGQVVAFLFGFLGLASGNLILLLIAVFIFMAAAAESSDVSLRQSVARLRARDAMITSYETLRPESTLKDAADALIRTTQHEFPVLTEDGRIAGFLTRRALYGSLRDGVRTRPVHEAMASDVPVVGPRDDLASVLDALNEKQADVVAVTDPRGHLIGYVTRENVGELMVVNSRGRG